MIKDYVRQVAKAVGNEEPIQELGRRLIDEISAEVQVLNEQMSEYQQQIATIRALMNRYPDTTAPTGDLVLSGHASSNGSLALGTPPPTPDLVTPGSGNWEPVTGLTEGQKLKVMAAAVSLVREYGIKADADLLLVRLAEQGEQLKNVMQPKAVAGSFLYRARLREKKNGQGG